VGDEVGGGGVGEADGAVDPGLVAAPEGRGSDPVDDARQRAVRGPQGEIDVAQLGVGDP
jgi:hypothetical protein